MNSLGSQLRGGANFKRAVLVEFPHPGMRSLAFVTNSLQDVSTGQTILSVFVLTGVMPPAGFTLFVAENSVTNIAWTANETLQAILSGGITTPSSIHFFKGLNVPLAVSSGPLVDAAGHVLQSAAPHGRRAVQPEREDCCLADACYRSRANSKNKKGVELGLDALFYREHG